MSIRIPNSDFNASDPDARASVEVELISTERLEALSRKNDHALKERFKKHFSTIAIIGLWVLFLLFLIALGIWGYNFLCPPSHRFLEESRISQIQTGLAIVVTSVLTWFIKDFFSKKGNS